MASKKTDLAKIEEFPDDIARAIAKGVNPFEAAMQEAQARYGEIVRASDVLGDGFTLIDDATPLIGQPFLLFDWKFLHGAYDGDFATMRIVTAAGTCYRYNDGGTGVFATLKDFSDRFGQTGGLYVGSGFRQSQYTTCKGCNKPRLPAGDAGNPPCTNLLPNDTECGDKSAERGVGRTLYLDISDQQ
jgi:hypothetical protein